MRKVTLLFYLVGLLAFSATEAKAQQPVSRNERRTVIKAIETKIAELEVKRAMDAPYYYANSQPMNIIDEQLVNLRKRLSELLGKRQLETANRRANRKTRILKNRAS